MIPEIQSWSVGQPFPRLPFREGVMFQFDNTGYVLYDAQPTAKETSAAFAEAEIDFALYAADGLIVLMYRVVLPPAPARGRHAERTIREWTDAPYSWHLVEADFRPGLDDAPEPAVVRVALIDSTTGVLRHWRFAALSEEMTRALLEAAERQSVAPFDRREYDRKVDRLYARYPTSKDLAKVTRLKCRARTIASPA